jgi:uncharacterized membrane protein
MALAFVFVNCRLDSAKVVLDEIMRITEVTEANILSGAYDIISKVEANTTEDVKRAIMKIRRIEGVNSSLTLLQAS